MGQRVPAHIAGKLVATAAVVLGVLVAACAQEVGGGSTVPNTTLPPSSVTTTTLPPITTTSATAPTTTTPPPTTTTTFPLWSVPGFSEALPPEAIPWPAVGTGWVLIRYEQASGPGEPGATAQALLLIDPNDTIYLVTVWSSQAFLLDWSPDGRRVLTYEDERLRVTNLQTGAVTVIPNDVYGSHPNQFEGEGRARWAGFTRPTGRDIVVRLLDFDHRRGRLECLRIDGTRFAALADVELSLDQWDPHHVFEGITWLYGPSGTDVVIATADGVSLIANDGTLIRDLDTPGLGCTLSRWWTDGQALAACYDPDWAASPCWERDQIGPGGGRSLWSVPVDGSSAVRLTPKPVCDSETWGSEYWPEYWDALPVGGAIAAQTVACCACYGGLDLIAGDTITPWLGYPGSEPPCAPNLVTTRQGQALVTEMAFGRDQDGSPTGWFGIIVGVAADGTTRSAIGPALLGRYGGTIQALTTDETNLKAGRY
jgi:hypothetical protein